MPISIIKVQKIELNYIDHTMIEICDCEFTCGHQKVYNRIDFMNCEQMYFDLFRGE